jgi:hypothetical protein
LCAELHPHADSRIERSIPRRSVIYFTPTLNTMIDALPTFDTA